LKVMRDGRPVTVEVTSDGAGLVSHAGTALIAQVADKVGLTSSLSTRLAGIKQRRRGHHPGRVIRDLAVMLVDGGECVSDLGAVRQQDALFGAVASDSTAFRVIDRIASTPGLLDAVRQAHARARSQFWELRGAPGRLTLDVDATLITAHSEKEQAAGNYKGGYGFHPLQVYLDETREALGGLLRPGNAGSNTAEDHKTVIDRALAQIPAEHVATLEILVRADSAGATHGRVEYCRDGGMRFSVGYELTVPVRDAILEIPKDAWVLALDQDGSERENGEVAEITDRVDLSAWGETSRLIVRRERPHPGAQLSFTDHDGYRFQAILTDQTDKDIAVVECRHRQHAHVEDRIREQGHRPVQVPVQGVRAERGVVGDRDARARPACLDPSAAPRRRPRQGRAQARPLPAAARRRTARVLRPPREASPPEHLAMGGRAPRRVPKTQDTRSHQQLTAAAGAPTTLQQTARPPGRDHRCPETGPAAHDASAEAPGTTDDNPKHGLTIASGPPTPLAPSPFERLLHVPG
jgi:hypothetical protein